MKKVISMGEALIDFIPAQTGCELKDVSGFTRACGGAPCNVAAAVSKLGGKSMMITQLGNDGFGDFIVETIEKAGVDISAVSRTDKANTGLAFVSLKNDGGREFSFYRNPSADMLLEADNIKEEWFDDAGIFHFCSVALVPSPMKISHFKAIEIAKKKHVLISFDPNIRLPLWDDKELLKATVLEYMKYSDIAKISDEEIEFITDCESCDEGIDFLFNNYQNLKAVIYSMGSDGAKLYKRSNVIAAKSKPVKAIDTTGAGDCIIGSFLYKLAQTDTNADNFSSLSDDFLHEAITFANNCSSISVTGHGAIASYPDISQVKSFAGDK